MAGQVLQVVHVPSFLGQGQERARLLWHMHEGRLSAGPLGPAAQYNCQQLAAVQLSLRSADLHCSLSRRLLAAAALKLCAFGVVTPGVLSRESSRWWHGGSSHPDYSSVLCNPSSCRWRRTGCRNAKFLRTGGGDCCRGPASHRRRRPWCLPAWYLHTTSPGLSMFSWRALAVALDAPQLFSNFTCV